MKIRIGNKVAEAEANENGVPVIKAWSEQIKRENGRVDVVVHVPCVKLQAKKE